MKHRLVGVKDFDCLKCTDSVVTDVEEKTQFVLSSGDVLECVDKFCYLGDMIGKGGGVVEAVRNRVRCAWSKFRELYPILAVRGVPLRVKGKIYRACVQSVLMYGSETWALRVEDMNKLKRAERGMIRIMCDVNPKLQKPSEELISLLGIDPVSDLVVRSRLRWFGHVERKSAEDWISACRYVGVEGTRGRGRGRKTWMENVRSDMKTKKLKVEDAQDRVKWKSAITGNRQTRTGADIKQIDVKR